MVNLVDFVGVCIDAGLLVRFHSIVIPTLFKKLVDHFHEFISHLVAGIVFDLLGKAE